MAHEHQFSLNRESGMPLYLQIAHELMYQLEMGMIRKGDKLPSIRTLAKELQVSFLTVDKAYKWLRSRGVVASRHGLGWKVVVSMDSSGEEGRRRVRISKFVDEMLDRAVEQGFDPMTIAQGVMHKAMAIARRIPVRKLVFVECYPEYLDDYTAELRHELADLNIKIEGLLTTTLGTLVRGRNDTSMILRDADYIMTTLYHYEFVQRTVARLNRHVVALSHTLDNEALHKIVSLPQGVHLGAILGHNDPAPAILRTLEFYRDLPPGSIPFAVMTDRQAVKKLQEQADVIAYTAACQKKIKTLLKENVTAILVRFVSDH